MLSHRIEDDAEIIQTMKLIFENVGFMGLMMDFMINEGSIPISIYQGNTPILLNNAFLVLSGYSMEQVMTYYEEYGEVTTLFYKGKDLEDVKSKFTTIEAVHRAGYKNIEFTMTRNPEK